MTSSSVLMLAICAVWLPSLPLLGRLRLPIWLPLLLVAVILGVIERNITMTGTLGIALLVLFTWRAQRASAGWERDILLLLALVLALLLALHRWPGFANPLLLSRELVSSQGLPFSLYANLDKGAAGLVLLALLAPRSRSWRDWKSAFDGILLPALLTIVLVMGLAWIAGMVRPDLKWPSFAAQFLLVNLFLTVVAEEAFFRGVIQHRLASVLTPGPVGAAISIGVSVILFGAAHLAGGTGYALLAAAAGTGYAFVFHRTGKIESAIAVHFALNAVHFLCFTYPRLA